MGISRNLAINIEGNRSVMQVPLTIYYMDRGIDLLFEIKNMDYMFSGNMLENLDNAEVSIIIIKPNGRVFRTSKAQIENNLVKLTITKEFTDELDEIGTYQLQFQFYSNEGQDRITIPPINFNVVELIAPIDDSQGEGQIDYAFTDVAQVSTKKGGEITARWVTQEYITADKLNLMQENGEKGKAALEEIEKARGGEEDLNSRLTTIEGASKITNQTLGEVKKEVEIARGEERTLVERLNNSDKKASNIEKELKMARGSYESLPNRLDTEEKHFYGSIAKINKEIGYRLEEGENITINHSHEGMMSNTEILGNTKYKRKDESLTDVWEEGVSLESTGEKEKNLIEIKSCGKNLFNIENLSNGEIVMYNNKKCYKYTDGSNYFTYKPTNLKNKTDYSLQMKIYSEKQAPVQLAVDFTDGTTYYETKTGLETIFNYKINNKKNIKSIRGSHYNSSVRYIDLEATQIEENPTPTPYEPYQGDTKQIQLPHPLRAVGDVKDRIYEKDGKVWLEQNVGEIVLNGSEDWKQYPDFKEYSGFYCEANFVKKETITKALSNNFNTEKTNIFPGRITLEGQNLCIDGTKTTYMKLSIAKNKLETVNIEGFKKWLKENPTTVLYELATPITTELDISNIDLKSYDNITHIMSNNNISPTIKTDVPYTLKDTIEGLYTKEQANVEFDRVYEILNLNSYAPYKGENISVKHSKMGRTKDTEILGNTIKNYSYISFTNKSDFLSFSGQLENGYILLKPTTEFTNCFTKPFPVDKGQEDYTLVLEVEENQNSTGTFVISGGSQYKEQFDYCAKEMGSLTKGVHFIKLKTKKDLSSTEIEYGLRSYVTTIDRTGKPFKFRYMLLKGDWTNKSIPNFFMGLKSIGEEEENKIEILSCGKNLCDNSKNQLKDIDSSDGHESVTNRVVVTDYINIKNIKKFSKSTTTKDRDIFERYYDANKKYQGTIRKDDSVYLRLRLYTGKEYKTPQDVLYLIEESPSPTTYEPYIEDTKQIQLPQPLRAVGDVKDKIYEKDGKVWLEQNIYEIKLNSEWQWKDDSTSLSTSGLYKTFFINLKDMWGSGLNKGKEYKETLSNNFRGNTSFKGDSCCYFSAGQLFNVGAKIQDLETQDVKGFKKWLSENPTTVLYQLETPITTELDISNIDLNTYSAMTHITSNNNIQSTINCQAPVDKDAINKELQETTLALEKENQKLLNAQNEQVAKDLDLDARMLTIEEAIKGEALTLDLGSVSKYSPYFMMKHCIEYGVYREDDIARKLDLYFRNKRITEEEKINITQLLEEKKNETIEK